MRLPPPVCPDSERQYWTDPLWCYYYACVFAQTVDAPLPEPQTPDEAFVAGQVYANHPHHRVRTLDELY